MGEPLNETASITPYPDPQRVGDGIVVRGNHYLHVSQPSTASKTFRATQHAVYNEVVLAFAPHAPSWPVPVPSARPSPFPENVGLLTLQHFKQGVVLLRVQHLFGVDEDATLSQVRALHVPASVSCVRVLTLGQPATIDLALVFEYVGIKVASFEETSLTANQVRGCALALPWLVQPLLPNVCDCDW